MTADSDARPAVPIARVPVASLPVDSAPATEPFAPVELSPEEAQEYVAYVAQHFRDLLRIVAKVASGDFSEKPEIHEREDDFSRFVVGFRFMIEDLERAQLEEAHRRRTLEEANARLRELNELRTRFINTAAHELNTPLTPLKIELYNLRHEADLPAGAKQSLDLVERNVDRLTRLVGDLLDAARLQSDKMKLVAVDMDLAALLGEAVDFFRSAAEHSGLTLEHKIGPGLRMQGDPVRLSQVFYNLLSNAIKFTPQGGTVRCEAASDGREIHVVVRDDGAGMDPGQIAGLFQPFGQVHELSAGRPRGNGLGLYISRGMVDLHGGRIWCESPGPGLGTTFHVRLPIRGRAGSLPSA